MSVAERLAGRRRGRRSVPVATALVGLGGVVIASALGAGVRANWTESMPKGLYREKAPRRLERGAWAVVCLEGATARLGRERGYLPRGDCPSGVTPVVKEIAAVPGDWVRIERSGLLVNGLELPGTALLLRDSDGRPLPHIRLGERRLAEDEFWVLGRSSPRSWDSRYFGAVASRQIVGTVTPWLICE